MNCKRIHENDPTAETPSKRACLEQGETKQTVLNSHFPCVLSNLILGYLQPCRVHLDDMKKRCPSCISVCCDKEFVWVIREDKGSHVWKTPLATAPTLTHVGREVNKMTNCNLYRTKPSDSWIKVRRNWDRTRNTVGPRKLDQYGVSFEDPMPSSCACTTADGLLLVAYSTSCVSPFGVDRMVGHLMVFERCSSEHPKKIRNDLFVDGILFSHVAIDWTHPMDEFVVVGLDQNRPCIHTLIQHLDQYNSKAVWTTILLDAVIPENRSDLEFTVSWKERCMCLVDSVACELWMYWF